MKTLDVVKTGIDRNFIRQCEDKTIIRPKRTSSGWVREDYERRIYTQEDVEKIWVTYLCRKMGLSFNQIKSFLNGENISLRQSLNDLINNYEKEIEERKAIIEFMKYVRGLGFIPKPPNNPLGSKNFTSYIKDFMNQLDEDGKLKEIINVSEYISEIDNIENTSKEEIEYLQNSINSIFPNAENELFEKIGTQYIELKSNIHLEPQNEQVQQIIQRIYLLNNELNCGKLSVWDFAINMLEMLDSDSVFKENLVKFLGKKGVEFYEKALIQFLVKYKLIEKAKEK